MVIPIPSKANWASLPVIPYVSRTFTKNKWLSVPETIAPNSANLSAHALVLTKTCLIYSLNSGAKASLKQVAFAPIICSNGPP